MDASEYANLETLTVEQLEDLIDRAQTILATRQRATADVFNFTFDETNDPRKGVPYVARLVWNETEKKIDREFVDLQKSYGRKSVTISGEYTARVGEIIEQRVGGSWNNDYRDWYVVTDAGELERVTGHDDSRGKMRVEKYLRRQITLTELIGEA